MKKILVFILFTFSSLFAIDCNSMSSVKSFNGHYYAKTSTRTSYDTIKVSAVNDKGYLAIPNSAEENAFIKSLVGGNSEAWIGIYDPNHAKNYCYDNASCFFDDTRFRDVKGQVLTYKNWASYEPNNFVESSDIKDNLAVVDPLGENWVIMNGNTGQWYDVGNHKSSNQNPRSHIAIVEFDEKPICYTESDAVTDTNFPERVCNTQVFDNNIANADKGITTKCLFDINGKEYCPQGLADAASYWSYIQGDSIKKISTVTDYAQGDYKEYTAIVRDFTNSSSTRNTGTVIDYDTGSYHEYTGVVTDWVNKEGKNNLVETKQYLDITSSPNKLTCSDVIKIVAVTNHTFIPGDAVSWSSQIINDMNNNIVRIQGIYYKVTYSYFLQNDGSYNSWFGITIQNVNTGQVYSYPYTYTYSGSGSTKKTGQSYSHHQITYASNSDAVTVTIKSTPNRVSWCNTNETITLAKKENQIVYNCPSDYSDAGTNCKKDINFKYYSYGCATDYTANNKGFTSFTKTDPDTTQVNWVTLDDDVNSPTPPAGNCTKILNYNYYTYGCESGYTVINAGLSTCNKTDTNTAGGNSSLADDCNSPTPPAANCYKDINYNYYTYSCPAGYSISNYGLTSCPKTDPNYSINNQNTLDDNCNNPTPPVGNCSKSIDYAYYQYVCTGAKNEFNQTYTPINSGLTSCSKSDTDLINTNTELSTDCNSSISPNNNCKTTSYTCNSEVREPVWLNDKWQCSPYPCYGNNNVEDLSKNVGTLDKDNNGWTQDGKCAGTIYIFSGGAKQCRSSDKFFGLAGGGCCKDDKYAMGLMSCNAEEKELQIKKEGKKCHYVGEYCSKKINIGVAKMCVRTSKSYCCFNSTLGRIIAEQGRNQLTDIDWGVASNPNCRGFTVEEFQRLDLSQMDLSEFTNSIQLPDVTNKQTAIIDKINSHINLIK